MTSSLSFPGCSHPGLVVAPSPGFDFTGLVVSGSSELGAAQSVLSVLSLHRILAFVRCELQFPPCFLAYCGAPWLMALRSRHCRITAGLVSMDRPLLVSAVCVSVRGLPRQLVGLGVYSPASPICPTSSVLKRSSFGISASVFASSLREGVTLPVRVCLS